MKHDTNNPPVTVTLDGLKNVRKYCDTPEKLSEYADMLEKSFVEKARESAGRLDDIRELQRKLDDRGREVEELRGFVEDAMLLRWLHWRGTAIANERDGELLIEIVAGARDSHGYSVRPILRKAKQWELDHRPAPPFVVDIGRQASRKIPGFTSGAGDWVDEHGADYEEERAG